MRAIFNFLFILGLLILITGCWKEDVVCTKSSSLTLIVYLGGDNNLSGEVVQKMAAIQFFSRSSDAIQRGEVNILIYRDEWNRPPQLYRCSYGATEATLVATYPEENSASAIVFNRVLEECRRYAPADRYGLLVFSHASGWLPEGTLNNPNRFDTRSVIVDGTSEMDMKDFAAAIPDKLFDYIVFESCFMAGVEVAYELKDKTNYLLASAAEMLSPGFTNIYSDILVRLISDRGTEISLIGAADVYFNHFNNKMGGERSATVSVIKTLGLDLLAAQVKRLQPHQTGIDINQVQHFDRNGNRYHLFFDLEDYIYKTSSVSLTHSLENVIVYRRATADFLLSYNGGFEIKKHCGLTIYIPQSKFPFLNEEYGKLKWGQILIQNDYEQNRIN